MLRFTTESFRDVTFFDKDGEAMLSAMGCSGRVPGAMRPDDLTAALASLRSAVQVAHALAQHAEDEEDADEMAVTPRSRAQPLIEMLETAIEHGDFVAWDHS